MSDSDLEQIDYLAQQYAKNRAVNPNVSIQEYQGKVQPRLWPDLLFALLCEEFEFLQTKDLPVDSQKYRDLFATHISVVDRALSIRGLGPPPPLRPPLPQNISYPFADFTDLISIGEGGMGSVFAAKQITMNRLVALKRVKGIPTDILQERLVHEALTLARLAHPSVVTIHGLTVDTHEQLYLVMELVAGQSLETKLGEGLQPRVAVKLTLEVASAIKACHQTHPKVIHGDLKPQNALITPSGQVKVIDFGLARDHSRKDQEERVAGTWDYAAPEQLDPTRGPITTRTDVHGLGATLFALLVGRPPFVGRGDGMATRLDQMPGPLPGVPRDLRFVCLKCLEPEPGDRFSSVDDLMAALEAWLLGPQTSWANRGLFLLGIVLPRVMDRRRGRSVIALFGRWFLASCLSTLVLGIAFVFVLNVALLQREPHAGAKRVLVPTYYVLLSSIIATVSLSVLPNLIALVKTKILFRWVKEHVPRLKRRWVAVIVLIDLIFTLIIFLVLLQLNLLCFLTTVVFGSRWGWWSAGSNIPVSSVPHAATVIATEFYSDLVHGGFILGWERGVASVALYTMMMPSLFIWLYALIGPNYTDKNDVEFPLGRLVLIIVLLMFLLVLARVLGELRPL